MDYQYGLMLTDSLDTIYALSTPHGKSGVAVIRVSGKAAKESLPALGVMSAPPPRMARLSLLASKDGVQIDKALVLFFPSPNSFTGEDIIELQVHGGRSVINAVLAELNRIEGFRLAQPGEFMRRAFLNGKMDLTAAEGLADLIDAETESQRRQAMRLMQGEAAKFFEELRAGIVHSLAYLEAFIDFPDEDIPPQAQEEVSNEVTALTNRITNALSRAYLGQTIREGVRIVIMGPPNAGKSSLLNLLAQRDVAIVSPIAGTTRDILEAHLDINGYSVTFVDTAGIREHKDEIEAEGIRRSIQAGKMADIKVIMLDSSEQNPAVFANELNAHMDEKTILVYNKTDLALAPADALAISTKTYTGIDKFLSVIQTRLAACFPPEPTYITRTRHQQHLVTAQNHLRNFLDTPSLPLELRCEELRSAAAEIGKITGIISVDELLGHIFSLFCIGK